MRWARLLLIPVLAGLVAAVASYAAFAPRQAGGAGTDLVPALVAARDIPARTLLSAGMVRVALVPRDLAAGAATAPQEVEGRITTAPLYQNELVLKAKLAGAGQGTLPYRMEKGQRAVTVRVDEYSGVAGHPQPGDLVDVILVLPDAGPRPAGDKAGDDPGRKVTQARLLFERVPVLARNMAPAPGGSNQAPEGPKLTSYTLALTPEHAVELALAEEIGHIKLALRPALPEENRGPVILDDSRYRQGR